MQSFGYHSTALHPLLRASKSTETSPPRLSHPMPLVSRVIANKENSILPSSLATTAGTSRSKLRISGIGRAPKRNTTTHSTKPYARIRTTSVQRAKLRATSAKLKYRPARLDLAAGAATEVRRMRRHRQPDRTVHIPLQLPKPVILPVGPLGGAGPLSGVVRHMPGYMPLPS